MKTWILLCCAVMFSTSVWPADSGEKISLDILQHLEKGELTKAKELGQKAEKAYPNFKWIQLLNADIQSIEMGLPTRVVNVQGTGEYSLKSLRKENQLRWQHYLYPPPKNSLPNTLLMTPKAYKHFILVSLTQHRLYLFENKNTGLTLLNNLYVGIGKAGYGKEREGDKKTPLGIYKITQYKSKDELPDLYGNGAFVLNYPNLWDAAHKKTGSGIWLHGVPKSLYNRPPQSSRGCITMTNTLVDSLKDNIDLNKTLVITTTDIEWLAKNKIKERQTTLLNALEDWRLDWESLNTINYLKHYSPHFQNRRKNYAQWVEHKTRVNNRKTFIKVSLSDISIIKSAGAAQAYAVSFKQHYRSNGMSSHVKKTQLWQQQNGTWKIIYEGSSLI